MTLFAFGILTSLALFGRGRSANKWFYGTICG
jgi:hypothetical protein